MDVSSVETLLQNPDCQKFLDAFLAEIGKVAGRTPYSDSFLVIFRAVDRQGAFHNAALPNSPYTTGTANARVGNPSLIINLDVAKANAGPQGSLAYTTIHEVVHAAAGSGDLYTHREMAIAAHNVGVVGSRFMLQRSSQS